MKNHKSTPPYFWKGRHADTLQYWHQKVRCVEDFNTEFTIDNQCIALLGYAVDEGVRRNQGRIGASLGPDGIKSVMGSMAYHLPQDIGIHDYGNIVLEDGDLEEMHALTKRTICQLLEKGYFPIILGGGHDLSFPHGSALMDHMQHSNLKLGVLNLDAHFDLRPLTNGMTHSGSPFLQLHKYATEKNIKLKYACMGIQSAANPKSLFELAKNHNVSWLTSDSCHLFHFDKTVDFLEEFLEEVDKVYLTIDLDGFSSAFAPGVSASSPMGFEPRFAFQVLEILAKSGKLVSMDVVEYNPNYDIDQITAKLAARCVEYTLRKIYE
ncbi:formimidoylglutamase [Belliella kenyensis]|uniref:Formimidoylglutamase n=1 Tax=Belliella kenyensis TaxID=1472724 RepID=A0ABV8EH53_9BACT|nr:formimidoylglutamase [Belliella kenyensis]MCH7401797.1 formimidoylglutamase [Belliella kenyensis]MDN3604296.1 formimidoylglutamase [Belliella kenyensis]